MDLLKANWTFCCSNCDWKGNYPSIIELYGYADCPECGSSCTCDEPLFEPDKEEEN